MSTKTYKVVGIRFKKAGKIYYFDPHQIALTVGDGAIVETTRGVEYGSVVTAPKIVGEEQVVTPLKRVIRKATPKDETTLAANKEKETEAYQICLEKIKKHGLPMKLIDVEQTFDNNKIIFYFTADGRVDFRELVKDLAAVFRTRIELRQIGVRDEAKMCGGLGCCGRELCCSSWLGEFAPVSIRMAKDQRLSLNPTKISGICGRLMCCLKYENEVYEDAKKKFPSIGSVVKTPEGLAKVIDYNIFKETVTAEIRENKNILSFPAHEIKINTRRGGSSGSPTGKNR